MKIKIELPVKLKKFGKIKELYCVEYNNVKNVLLKNEWLGQIVEKEKKRR